LATIQLDARVDRRGRPDLRLIQFRRLQERGLSLAEIRDRLDAPSAPMLAEAAWAPLEPRLATHRSMPMASAPVSIGRSVWERIALAPDLELQVRRPHDAATRRLVEEIRSLVDRRPG